MTTAKKTNGKAKVYGASQTQREQATAYLAEIEKHLERVHTIAKNLAAGATYPEIGSLCHIGCALRALHTDGTQSVYTTNIDPQAN